jgi:hypothetical protein
MLTDFIILRMDNAAVEISGDSVNREGPFHSEVYENMRLSSCSTMDYDGSALLFVMRSRVQALHQNSVHKFS